jgi:hypothetical protein
MAETDSSPSHVPVQAHAPFGPPLHEFVWHAGEAPVPLAPTPPPTPLVAPVPVVPVKAPPVPAAPPLLWVCPPEPRAPDVLAGSTTTFPPQAASTKRRR